MTAAIAAALASLLAIAPSVEASCAWLLWEHRTDFGRELHEMWAIMKTYDSAPPCREDHAKLLSGTTVWSIMGGEPLKVDNGFTVIRFDGEGKRVGSTTKLAYCLPDTIDPRGPKGGGR